MYIVEFSRFIIRNMTLSIGEWECSYGRKKYPSQVVNV